MSRSVERSDTTGTFHPHKHASQRDARVCWVCLKLRGTGEGPTFGRLLHPSGMPWFVV